jgi:hypothetical protein
MASRPKGHYTHTKKKYSLQKFGPSIRANRQENTLFIGHYGAAFVAKRVEPRLPLWALLLAAQFVDVCWAIFIMLGVEKASLNASLPSNPLELSFMPYTHSFVATLGWGTGAFLVGMLSMHGGVRRIAFGLVLAATVMSHWFLDWIMHRQDLPLWGDEVKVGLALWNWPLTSYFLELAVVAASIAWMIRSKTLHIGQLRSRILILGGVLFVLQTGNHFGAVPGSVQAIALTALALYLGVAALGKWVEH